MPALCLFTLALILATCSLSEEEVERAHPPTPPPRRRSSNPWGLGCIGRQDALSRSFSNIAGGLRLAHAHTLAVAGIMQTSPPVSPHSSAFRRGLRASFHGRGTPWNHDRFLPSPRRTLPRSCPITPGSRRRPHRSLPPIPRQNLKNSSKISPSYKKSSNHEPLSVRSLLQHVASLKPCVALASLSPRPTPRTLPRPPLFKSPLSRSHPNLSSSSRASSISSSYSFSSNNSPTETPLTIRSFQIDEPSEDSSFCDPSSLAFTQLYESTRSLPRAYSPIPLIYHPLHHLQYAFPLSFFNLSSKPQPLPANFKIQYNNTGDHSSPPSPAPSKSNQDTKFKHIENYTGVTKKHQSKSTDQLDHSKHKSRRHVNFHEYHNLDQMTSSPSQSMKRSQSYQAQREENKNKFIMHTSFSHDMLNDENPESTSIELSAMSNLQDDLRSPPVRRSILTSFTTPHQTSSFTSSRHENVTAPSINHAELSSIPSSNDDVIASQRQSHPPKLSSLPSSHYEISHSSPLRNLHSTGHQKLIVSDSPNFQSIISCPTSHHPIVSHPCTINYESTSLPVSNVSAVSQLTSVNNTSSKLSPLKSISTSIPSSNISLAHRTHYPDVIDTMPNIYEHSNVDESGLNIIPSISRHDISTTSSIQTTASNLPNIHECITLHPPLHHNIKSVPNIKESIPIRTSSQYSKPSIPTIHENIITYPRSQHNVTLASIHEDIALNTELIEKVPLYSNNNNQITDLHVMHSNPLLNTNSSIVNVPKSLQSTKSLHPVSELHSTSTMHSLTSDAINTFETTDLTYAMSPIPSNNNLYPPSSLDPNPSLNITNPLDLFSSASQTTAMSINKTCYCTAQSVTSAQEIYHSANPSSHYTSPSISYHAPPPISYHTHASIDYDSSFHASPPNTLQDNPSTLAEIHHQNLTLVYDDPDDIPQFAHHQNLLLPEHNPPSQQQQQQKDHHFYNQIYHLHHQQHNVFPSVSSLKLSSPPGVFRGALDWDGSTDVVDDGVGGETSHPPPPTPPPTPHPTRTGCDPSTSLLSLSVR